ncbi:MAG: RcnB family protein [Phenylobacterium sp.]
MPPGQAKKLWRQGERLPSSYISQRYYVAEPSRHSLAPTPYGYRWVKVGDQYYLAQTQSGAISQVISALAR